MHEKAMKHIQKAMENLDFNLNALKCINDIILKNLNDEKRKLASLYFAHQKALQTEETKSC